MRQSHIIIRDGQEEHRLELAQRDWGLLSGPFFEEGQQFIDALGVYKHFTVADGIPTGSQITQERLLLVAATEAIHRAIERDADLLGYDYSYSFTGRKESRSSGAKSGFRIHGLLAHVSARPHGYCHLRLSQPGANGSLGVVEFIDMRAREYIETDDLGVLKIHRQRASVHWPERLPPLLEFLRARRARQITIEHYSR